MTDLFGYSGENDVFSYAEKAERRAAEEAALKESQAAQANFLPGLARTALQGLTFGFGDELEGGVVGALDPNQDYTGARDVARQSVADFGQQNEGMGLITELGGMGLAAGLSVPAAVAALGLKTMSGVPNWLKLSGLSGLGAGIETTGKAENLQQVPGDLAVNVPVAAALGPVAPWAAGKLAKGVGRGANWVGDQFTNADTFAGRKIQEALSQDYMDPMLGAIDPRAARNQVADVVEGELDRLRPGGTIADAGGENTLALGRASIDMPGPGRNQALTNLRTRQAGQGERLDRAISASSGTDENFYKHVDDLTEERRLNAATDYEAAYAVDIPNDPELEKILMRPSATKGWKDAKLLAAEEDIRLPEIYEYDAAGGVIGIREIPDMRAWDRVKQGIDSVIEKNTDALTGKVNAEGRAAYLTKKKLLGILDDYNEPYKIARAKFSDNISVENAARLGRNILKEDYEISQKAIRDMSEAERESYIIGATRAIRDKIRASGETHDATRKVLGNNLLRERMQNAFPDGGFDEFMDAVRSEQTKSVTYSRMTGGSPTSKNLAGQDALVKDPGAMIDIAQGNIPRVAMTAARKLLEGSRGIPPDQLNAISGMLFDPARSQDVIDMLRRAGAPPGKIRQVYEFIRENGADVGAAISGAAIGDSLTEE